MEGSTKFDRDVVILGGCGHVGLPLGMAFAGAGLSVELLDRNADVVQRVNAGDMPFRETGADALLPSLREIGSLHATTDPEALQASEHVVVVVGTPVDRYLSPDITAVPDSLEPVARHFRDGQLLVLRSTVYPGVTRLVEQQVSRWRKDIDVCFCPERIAEGHALEELNNLPQLIAARSSRAMERASTLFRRLNDDIVELTPEEAELAKLFTNTWRYIKFATANQLFMIANDFGLDFERIRGAVVRNYPRAADMPGPGFAAGPCLFKDTMQIAAFYQNNFSLGHAAVMVNEGMPIYMVNRLEQRYDLATMTVGILGMAFKANSDDTRSSLSYKLKRLLGLKAKRVLCTDPHVTTDAELAPLAEVLREADLIVIATPHREYANLDFDVPVVDLQNLLGNGVLV